MELVVLGNSVSAGTGLGDPEIAWPWLAAQDLGSSLGRAVSVRHTTFAPIGGAAPDYALKRLGDTSDAIVVVVLGSYVCAVGTVAERVRQRWGEAWSRRYLRLEHAFEGRTGNRRGLAARANRAGRRLSRRLIGVATMTTVEEVIEVYSSVLAGLARSEHTDVVVFPEPYWPQDIERENAGANAAFDRIRQELRVVADRHHFLWADAEPAWSEVPDRNVYYQPDLTHKSEEGHRLLAAALVESLSVAPVQGQISSN